MVNKDIIYNKITELARKRGFVWSSSEIYGSIAGFIDYGPLGAMMKRRIENMWRQFYVVQEGYYEIECPSIGIEPIYVASGHVGGFSDKMFQCPHCQEFFRADHVAEALGIQNAGTMSKQELHDVLINKKCLSCGKPFGSIDVFDFNLMFSTNIGPGSQRKGYLRPETAQGMFVNFQRLLRFYRDHLPFGAVQIGKSYRNEISPRQGMIRLREFTQAEAEIFVDPKNKSHPFFERYAEYSMPLYGITQQEQNEQPVTKTMRDAVNEGIIANEYVAYYLALTHNFLCQVGINPDRIRFRQHLPTERAHYATDCWDAEALSDRFGWVEIVGIADRTDYDLKAHSSVSGEKMTLFVQYPTPKKVNKHLIVPNFSKLGPVYKDQAKQIAEIMSNTDIPDDVSNGLVISVNNTKITIPPEMYTVKSETVNVFGEEITPHVIEPSYGIDRITYMVMEHAYTEEKIDDDARIVMKFKHSVSPIQVAVLPLMAKDTLDTIAKQLVNTLKDAGFQAEYDDTGAIGRRYRRQDEVGTPICVTIDYDTKEDGTATIRDRDSMNQFRAKISEIPNIISNIINNKQTFDQYI
ncbi:MAG TPA: glycine--tRNA ligase [Methanocorpusculum sp.]|nr:glycine--tRNA ligase [Methanocorpusculum sp.]